MYEWLYDLPPSASTDLISTLNDNNIKIHYTKFYNDNDIDNGWDKDNTDNINLKTNVIITVILSMMSVFIIHLRLASYAWLCAILFTKLNLL